MGKKTINTQHEKWVLDILNFLQSVDIPFYSLDTYGQRVLGKDKDIPERLSILRDRMGATGRELLSSRMEVHKLTSDLDKLRMELKKSEGLRVISESYFSKLKELPNLYFSEPKELPSEEVICAILDMVKAYESKEREQGEDDKR